MRMWVVVPLGNAYGFKADMVSFAGNNVIHI